MNVNRELAFLASLEFFGIKMGLEQTCTLFRLIGNPEKKLKFIHVAGSNGKGSVSALIEAGLRQEGYKTGFYSSPHLLRVGERFRVNGLSVSEETVAEYVVKIRPAIDEMSQQGMKVTYFEATTAIAAMIFADNNVDFVVWEVGMGGRLDSTNIVIPEVSVITSISLEHTEYLGDTIQKIASEKAGIVKESVPVFYSYSLPYEAQQVISNRAAELNSPVYISQEMDENKPLQISKPENDDKVLQTFTLKTGEVLTLSLPGFHQRYNASLAWSVLKYLAEKYHFNAEDAMKGWQSVRWEARFQILSEQHLIIDGAHNPEGVNVLTNSLKEIFPGEKFHFIFGAFSDKDTADSLQILAPIAKSFRFVHMDTARSSKTTAELCNELRRISAFIPQKGCPLGSALLEKIPNDNCWNVLCGSLHLCGDALNFLKQNVH